jgi:phosphate transport system protein
MISERMKTLHQMLCDMGRFSKQTVQQSINDYLESKDALEAYRITRQRTYSSLEMQESIEDNIYEIIVRFQPVATDLRLLKSYMQTAYHFSRFCRYALDIAEIQAYVIRPEDCKPSYAPVKEIGNKVVDMVSISIQALEDLDTGKAKSIGKKEEEVDGLYTGYLTNMMKDTTLATKCAVSNILTVKYLERIADHAAYISESIVYGMSGEKVTLR